MLGFSKLCGICGPRDGGGEGSHLESHVGPGGLPAGTGLSILGSPFKPRDRRCQLLPPGTRQQAGFTPNKQPGWAILL